MQLRRRHSLITILLFLIASTSGFAIDVNLAWNPNTESVLAGYKIYYGTASRTYGTPIVVGKITNYSVTGLGPGTYYFAVKAYDTLGNESGFSNEVSTTLSCAYALSASGQSFSQAAGAGSVTVTASTGCNWTAASNAGWITISSGSSGSGNGTVNYSVAANTATASRTGTLTIAGQTFTVTQTGVGCTYSTSPVSQSFTDSAATGSVAVTAAVGCSWTAVSNASWITISSGSSGGGNGTVNYSVSANTTATSRTGTLTIAGQLFVVTQNATYNSTSHYAQFASGAGWQSTLVVTNPSRGETATGSASFLNKKGEPAAVSFGGQAPGSVVPFTIPPLGSFSLTSSGAGDLVSGSVQVGSDIPVAGVVKYAHPDLGLAGIGESSPLRSVITSVVRDASRGSNTGIALSNPQSHDLELTLSLKGMDGLAVSGGYAVQTLPPNGNLAKFIHELFPNADTGNFRGTLLVSATSPEGNVCATALQLGVSAREFNSMPVVPVDPAPAAKQLFFAQFANGADWTSSLDLVNPLNSSSGGTVTAFDDQGNRLAISVSGQPASDNVSFDIQPYGAAAVRTDGQGNLIVGSARVVASSAIGGVLTFGSPDLGIAGVGPSIPLAGFISPMTRSVSRKVSTGVAIASVGAAVTLRLSLRDPGGQPVTGGEITLDLPKNGHLARFLEQLFPDADTGEFDGTLTVRSEGGDIIGTAIQIGGKKGEITALPVTALR